MTPQQPLDHWSQGNDIGTAIVAALRKGFIVGQVSKHRRGLVNHGYWAYDERSGGTLWLTRVVTHYEWLPDKPTDIA